LPKSLLPTATGRPSPFPNHSRHAGEEGNIRRPRGARRASGRLAESEFRPGHARRLRPALDPEDILELAAPPRPMRAFYDAAQDRAFMEFLYDHNGPVYLDAVNNVPHVATSSARRAAAASCRAQHEYPILMKPRSIRRAGALCPILQRRFHRQLRERSQRPRLRLADVHEAPHMVSSKEGITATSLPIEIKLV